MCFENAASNERKYNRKINWLLYLFIYHQGLVEGQKVLIR